MKSKRLLLLSTLLLPAVTASINSNAQTPFSTITGTVWQEKKVAGLVDGLMNADEKRIPGVLVTLFNETADTIIASAISNNNGQYVLNNFNGPGNYIISFNYPESGYSVTDLRTGSDNNINSSVTDYGEGDLKTTAAFAINAADAGSNLSIYNLGLVERPNKRVYSIYKAYTNTAWNDTFKLPKSSATTGVLSRAKLFVTDAAFHPSIGIENTSVSSPSTGTISLGGKVSVRLPNNNTTNLSASTQVTKSAEFPVYDGTTDYAGTSGKSWNNTFSAAYSDYTYPALNASHFVGTDSVSLPINAVSTTTISGGGNLTSNIATRVAAGVFVVYEYDGGALPITLGSFEAQISGTAGDLRWITFKEENNIGFDIERSPDGKTFQSIGQVSSKANNGNSSMKISYTYTDENPLNGNNFYRLKQTDFDGKTSYSVVRVLNFAKSGSIGLYPNPAHNTLTVYGNDVTNIILSNLTGQTIQAPITYSGALAVINVSALNAGTYFANVISANGTSTSLRFCVH